MDVIEVALRPKTASRRIPSSFVSDKGYLQHLGCLREQAHEATQPSVSLMLTIL